MKTWHIVILVLVVALIAFYIGRKWKFSDEVTFYLPTNKPLDVWGPEYWRAYHEISNRIPCEECRRDAVPLMVFMHDIVNAKKGKKLYDPQNFKMWQDKVAKINPGA